MSAGKRRIHFRRTVLHSASRLRRKSRPQQIPRPWILQIDLRVSRRIALGERMSIDLIADGFNLLNRTNIAAVNQLCDPTGGATCSAGQPTAAYDSRQFQFALKLNW